MIRISPILLGLLVVSLPLAAAELRYVTDETEITMRTGPSTANKIVRVLKSGDSVTLLESDPETQYSLIEIDNGTQGYVITRFLRSEPIARQQLATLQANHQQQKQLLDEQSSEIGRLQQELQQEQEDNEVLKTTLRASEEELSKIREAAQNTLSILEQNKRMQTVVDQLREEKIMLSDANASLSDSTQIDWFVRGAAVSLIAFVIGILVTRIRWRKQDSWGSY